MEIETKYGWFIVTKTATGLRAEKFGTSAQFFLDGSWLPQLENTMDVALLEQKIEDEYEFQHDL